jgi:hypothetical protein
MQDQLKFAKCLVDRKLPMSRKILLEIHESQAKKLAFAETVAMVESQPQFNST